jgi:serpin B
LLAETRHTMAYVAMPRFQTRLGANLSDILVELGMPLAFSDVADFSGMREGGGLKIEAVAHEAVIELDESGTEAAAATAVLMVPISTAEPPEPISVRIDRPFIYLIRDSETGAVLFMGRMLDPSI